jgi:predicted heme/steroid binding protein
MDTLTIYNRFQLSSRNGLHGSDCWVAYKGYIYDVTSSSLFRNGKHFRLAAGQDLTADMPDAPHLDDVLTKFPIVGVLENG